MTSVSNIVQPSKRAVSIQWRQT